MMPGYKGLYTGKEKKKIIQRSIHMCPTNPSISKLGIEAAKRQTKNELKVPKRNCFLTFQE